MMKAKKTPVMLACLVPLLVSCAGVPGGEPGAVAPRIVTSDNEHIWDNPSAFGEVPAGYEAKGNATCRANGFRRATGFHPNALDENGKPFRGGGYYCVDRLDNNNKSS